MNIYYLFFIIYALYLISFKYYNKKIYYQKNFFYIGIFHNFEGNFLEKNNPLRINHFLINLINNLLIKLILINQTFNSRSFCCLVAFINFNL